MLNKSIFVFLFSFVFALNAFSETILRWAADTESGAPFVFRDSKNPDNLRGFELDIVKILAKKLNVKDQYVQNSWDGLILGLQNGLYDIAINGIEITDERKKVVFFSEPYYSTYLQIVVRASENRFTNLSSLSGYKVGTLTGALSEKVLRSEEGVQVVTYENEALAHQDLLINRLDALLFDAPIAKYYSEVDSRFKILPAVIGAMTYGVAVSKKNPELLKKVNQALEEMKRSGELKDIYEKWGLWNPSTANLFGDFSPSRNPPVEFEKFKASLNLERTWADKVKIYKKAFPTIAQAALQTIKISFSAMVLAVCFGLVLAMLRLFGPAPLKTLVIGFVELIRGTPLLLQLFFIFYGLPSVGVQISAYWAAVLGLGVNYSVQESEIYRSGLLSIHRHQIEAAKMLGLSRLQTFWNIEVPQAFRVCLPPMTSDFIALIKDSSLVSVITLVELTKVYSMLSSTYYDYVGFAALTAATYLVIGLPLVFLSRNLEKYFSMVRGY